MARTVPRRQTQLRQTHRPEVGTSKAIRPRTAAEPTPPEPSPRRASPSTPSEPAASSHPGRTRPTRKGRFHLLKQILQNALTLGGALLLFYFVPIGNEDHPIWRWAVFVIGLGVLIMLIVRQMGQTARRRFRPGVRVRSLIALLYPVVVLFALTYYIIQTTDPTQFVDLATRTDALYYTVITLGTVGYGDVHAAGQLARVISMIQVAFDLVVIGALIAVATSRFQVVPRRTRSDRRSRHRAERPPPTGRPPSSATTRARR